MNQVVTFAEGQIEFALRPGRRCWSLWEYPQTGYEVQVWAKPQQGGAVAVLLINSNQTDTLVTTVLLSKLNLSGTVAVRDVWQHTDNGTITGSLTTGTDNIASIPPAASLFLVLSPT